MTKPHRDDPAKIRRAGITCVAVAKSIYPIPHYTLTLKPNTKENSLKALKKQAQILQLKGFALNYNNKP